MTKLAKVYKKIGQSWGWYLEEEEDANGGSLPSQWTVDDHGNAVIAPDDGATPNYAGNFKIVAPSDSNDAFTITDAGNAGSFNFGIDPYGYIIGPGADFSPQTDVTVLKLDGSQNTVHDVFQARDASSFKIRLTFDGRLLLPDLPTSDPAVADQLWNDAGTLKISAG